MALWVCAAVAFLVPIALLLIVWWIWGFGDCLKFRGWCVVCPSFRYFILVCLFAVRCGFALCVGVRSLGCDFLRLVWWVDIVIVWWISGFGVCFCVG